MFVLALIVAFVVGSLVGLVLGLEVSRRHPTAVATIAPPVGPVCEVCGATATPLRTHDGHYLCPQHKAARAS